MRTSRQGASVVCVWNMWALLFSSFALHGTSLAALAQGQGMFVDERHNRVTGKYSAIFNSNQSPHDDLGGTLGLSDRNNGWLFERSDLSLLEAVHRETVNIGPCSQK